MRKQFVYIQAIPAGLELEMALMREERQRDKELKERNTSIVDRRVWENHEIGVGYQHKNVMRQAVVQHEKVRIKDMTKEKRKKKSAAEQDAEAKKEEEVKAAAELEAFKRLRALIWRELRGRKRLDALEMEYSMREHGCEETLPSVRSSSDRFLEEDGQQTKSHRSISPSSLSSARKDKRSKKKKKKQKGR
ncbi:hypothetical protein Naga_100589g2 [Nannochloropsis gaditana]|uniref:Uncharacterized protein n=1 Tax=Nannochloropsis gaditana TaxID=72520 RepID=W7TKF5_9STRA|nr:hypothetical protein Naga_100589g2 [Nannochloropsis gaditana]